MIADEIDMINFQNFLSMVLILSYFNQLSSFYLKRTLNTRPILRNRMSYLPIIDFGVNYGSKHYSIESLTPILTQASNANVTHVVSISNSIREIRQNIIHCKELREILPSMHYLYTAGCHPHNAKDFRIPQDLHYLEQVLQDPNCIAIGECGLDYNRNFSPREQQIQIFELQIQLAKRYHKQLYLHCRDAFDDFLEILKRNEYYYGIVHCFTGDVRQAMEFTSLGFNIGITGWLLDKRRNRDLLAAVEDHRIPLDRLIVETDAPYLSINRKRKSIPEDTHQILQKIAEIKGISNEECYRIIYESSLRMIRQE